jgi:hypothetical protein
MSFKITAESDLWESRSTPTLVVIKLFTKKYLRTNRQQMISLGLTCDQVKINFPAVA